MGRGNVGWGEETWDGERKNMNGRFNGNMAWKVMIHHVPNHMCYE